MQFKNAERVKRIEQMALSEPGVTAAEMWQVEGADIRLNSQAEAVVGDENAQLFGVAVPSNLYTPQMRAGRWLLSNDTHAVVLHEKLANDTGITVGDRVTFDHGADRESTWQVVGILFDPLTTNAAYLPYHTLIQEIGGFGEANTLWLRTQQTNDQDDAVIANNLRTFFEDRNISVSANNAVGSGYATITDIQADALFTYNIITALLGIMAVLAAIIGGIGLSGVLSLSVLERRREIGVMRAIGASSGHIARLFIGEGLLLGYLSWLIALPFSVLAANWMVTQGLSLALEQQLIYQFAPRGAWYWLGIITILAIIASWLPARGATRISVRASLMYQ